MKIASNNRELRITANSNKCARVHARAVYVRGVYAWSVRGLCAWCMCVVYVCGVRVWCVCACARARCRAVRCATTFYDNLGFYALWDLLGPL